MTDLAAFLERLRAAHFSGSLEVHMHDGQPYRIELQHLIGIEQITKPLVTVEPDPEFKLEP